MIPVRGTDAMRVSYAQQQMWFTSQLRYAGPAHLISLTARLEGALDCGALEAAFRVLIERHEVLRTVFKPVNGMPVPRVVHMPEFSLQKFDLRQLAAEERAAKCTRHALEETNLHFDLSEGPLIRGRLLRLGEIEHALLMTMHHIVSDGWSIGILIREVGQLYAAQRAGREHRLPPLPIQYADYALWQWERLQGESLELELRYWKEQLANAPTILDLPLDQSRPELPSYRGEDVDIELSAELSGGLRKLGKRHQATLFMTLYLGFALLLSRLSGRRDVVVGVPMANRQSTEVEGLIGCFVNTLALRLRIGDELTIGELLERVKEQTLEAYSHQHVPFELVVEAVQPQRTLSHSPLFQVLFALQNQPQEVPMLSELRLRPMRVSSSAAKFDLSLSLQESGERIVGTLNYASDLFDRSTIERWVGYLQALLRGMVADEHRPVSELPLLSAAEREQVLKTFNATAAAYPKDQLIHELFEAQVRRTPTAVAVVYEEEQLTYEQLNARANQLAHYLRTQGIGADDRVGLCLERSVWMVVGLLGILKAGGAYVPLDPSYPPERLGFMLEDASPRLVLTQGSLHSSVPTTCAPVLSLDSEWACIDAHPSTDLARAASAAPGRQLAYVIYTSGSTGTPKGVMVEHDGLRNYLHWAMRSYSMKNAMGAAVISSIAFDATITGLWGPLLCGGAVRLTAEGVGIEGLSALLSLHSVDVVKISPALLHVLGQNYPARQRCGAGAFVIGGEALSPATVALWQKLAPQVRLINEYGPTETVVGCTTYEVPGDWDEARAVPIGTPIANTQIYILDERLCPAPIGVSGEIYIGGAGVARGYLKRAGLTAQRFIADPFGEAGARLYRSGDLGRWRSDGTIEYLGRNDQQVKLRGYRIELGEIEAQLSRHAQVKEVVVLAREDEPGEKRLVAYVTAREGELSIETLRAQLQGMLPEYMVPSAYVVLAQLPLTPNGKVDRKQLPAPDGSAQVRGEYEAPQGELECTLAQIWQTLLRVERVSRHDNFFELGGHSLLIVQMIERLRRLDLHADMSAVFNSANLAALASVLKGRAASQFVAPPNLIPEHCERITPQMLTLVELNEQHIDNIVRTVPGGAANVQDIYPLAPLQEGILFHHLLNKERDTYLLRSVLELSSQEARHDLLRAIQTVIDRHDILRSAVLWQDLPRPVQVVYRQAKLPVLPLELEQGQDVLSQLKARMVAHRVRLDLQQAPLLRIELAHDPGAPAWYVILYLHHMVADHVAMELVIRELSACLEGGGEPLRAVVPYRAHVAYALAEVANSEAEAFFRERLGDIDEPTAPFDLIDVRGDGSQFAEARVVMDLELSRRIRTHARRLNVSSATLFHAAWALVVAHCSGREDVVFGTVLSGRSGRGVAADEVVGMFINTLPLRLSIKTVDVEQFVTLVQEELVALLKYEQQSLALAQRCSGISGSVPLFSAVLNYRHSHAVGERPGRGLSGIKVVAAQERTNYPFGVSVDDLGEGFALTAQTDRRIEPGRVIEYHRTALEGLLQALECAPRTPMCTLGILPETERRQVLETFNATAVEYPQRTMVHLLFEQQVMISPQAVAAVAGDEQLSYAQMNARANQLARCLRAQGAGPGQFVALYMDRGLEMVVALLGILKAGSAYVPLDPSYPPDRVAFMVEDAAPLLILTERKLAERLTPSDTGMLLLDVDRPRLLQNGCDNLGTDAGAWLTADDPVFLGLDRQAQRGVDASSCDVQPHRMAATTNTTTATYVAVCCFGLRCFLPGDFCHAVHGRSADPGSRRHTTRSGCVVSFAAGSASSTDLPALPGSATAGRIYRQVQPDVALPGGHYHGGRATTRRARNIEVLSSTSTTAAAQPLRPD